MDNVNGRKKRIREKDVEAGRRIKAERITVGFRSQSAFAVAMGYSPDSRQTIGGWESGEFPPNMVDLKRMCELFNCELGYLLCECECKTRVCADVRQETGLTEDAIMYLRELSVAAFADEEAKTVLWFLNKLIEDRYTLKELSSCADEYEYIKNHAGQVSEHNVYVRYKDGAEIITPSDAQELKLARCSDYVRYFVKGIEREEE